MRGETFIVAKNAIKALKGFTGAATEEELAETLKLPLMDVKAFYRLRPVFFFAPLSGNAREYRRHSADTHITGRKPEKKGIIR